MSGGDFDYVFRLLEDDPREDSLRAMFAWLEKELESGGLEARDWRAYRQALEQVRGLQLDIANARKVAPLLRAIEWVASGDSSPEVIAEALDKLKEQP